jgi:hypothetical protein
MDQSVEADTGGTPDGQADAPMDQSVEADAGDTPDGQADAEVACVEEVLTVEAAAVDLFFMVDVSGSMSGSNITALKYGFADFANDPMSAGLGAAAQRFPIAKANDPYDATCDQNVYAKPTVPWGPLPNPALVSWVEALVASGYTPTVPALTGAVRACDDRLAVMPTHKCAVVLVTDGRPEGNCPPINEAAELPLGQVAAGAWAAGIPVFAIGFPGLDSIGQAVLDAIAAHGGTGSPFIIQTANPTDDFSQVLAEIRAVAQGCEYLMPSLPTGVDPDLLKVTYTSDISTVAEELPHVTDDASCAGDGWYFDDNASPSRIILCPFTCDKLRNDEGSEVTFSLGCSEPT